MIGCRWGWAAALALALTSAACERTGTLQIKDAYVAAPAGDAPAAMYVTISNSGNVPDTLVRIVTPAAERAEAHEQMRHGGRVRMAPAEALEIPASGELRMAPGGYHIMLMGARKDLAPGDTVDAELVFRRAGPVAVRAAVVSYAELARVLGEAGGARMHGEH